MLAARDETGRIAERYIASFGPRAGAKIVDDISRAIGARGWDQVHLLQRAHLRIRRRELCEQRTAGRSVRASEPM